MSKTDTRRTRERSHPTDKYARPDQAPPPGDEETPKFAREEESGDMVEEASKDSFPASDPPAYTSAIAP